MKEYQSIEAYKKAIEILDMFTTIILFSFVKHGIEVKEIIIRNFIARAIVALKGILKISILLNIFGLKLTTKYLVFIYKNALL